MLFHTTRISSYFTTCLMNSHFYRHSCSVIEICGFLVVFIHLFIYIYMLSRLVIAFLPRSKCLLISWLQSPSAVFLESKKIKSVTVSIVSPSVYHKVMRPDAIIFVFWMLSFKQPFSLSSFTFIKRLLCYITALHVFYTLCKQYVICFIT